MKPDPKPAILAAAWQHLRVQGAAALHMDALAAQLRVSKKTLYKHFGSKQALLTAVFDERAACYHQRLQLHADLSAELSPALSQELAGSAPALWRRADEFLRAATRQLLACQLRAAEARATP